MTDHLDVTVTRELIVRGKRGYCEMCPFALALVDAEPDIEYAHVDASGFWFSRRDGTEYYGDTLPLVAAEFITNFDFGKSVDPITVRLPYKRFEQGEEEICL